MSFYEGGSVKLTSNVEKDIFWSTGASSKSITVAQNGIYTVSQVNYLGCFAKSSGTSVDVLSKPDVKIVAEGETTFCADKSVMLRANNGKNLVWNNGETNSMININKRREYFAQAKNEFGCEAFSQIINIRVYPKPEVPFIKPDCPTSFCADKSVKLTSSIRNGINWSTGDKLASLQIFKAGEYFFMARNEFGCQSI
jgi:hypothetical protein